MPALSAANRMREKVLAVPGTVLIAGAGHPDEVIRFTDTPECLLPFRKKVNNVYAWPVFINLDRGPHQEAWALAKREAFVRSRRDKPLPEPLRVSMDCKEEWAVDAEDVPVVEYLPSPDSAPKEYACLTCTKAWPTQRGLEIHQGRTKHE